MSGTFKKEIKSTTSINVGLLVSPTAGISSERYSFSVLDVPAGENYQYTWSFKTGTQTKLLRSEISEDSFTEFISIPGNEANGYQLFVNLLVIDTLTQERRLYTTTVVNTKGTFTTTDLGSFLLPETKSAILNGLSQQE